MSKELNSGEGSSQQQDIGGSQEASAHVTTEVRVTLTLAVIGSACNVRAQLSVDRCEATDGAISMMADPQLSVVDDAELLDLALAELEQQGSGIATEHGGWSRASSYDSSVEMHEAFRLNEPLDFALAYLSAPLASTHAVFMRAPTSPVTSYGSQDFNEQCSVVGWLGDVERMCVINLEATHRYYRGSPYSEEDYVPPLLSACDMKQLRDFEEQLELQEELGRRGCPASVIGKSTLPELRELLASYDQDPGVADCEMLHWADATSSKTIAPGGSIIGEGPTGGGSVVSAVRHQLPSSSRCDVLPIVPAVGKRVAYVCMLGSGDVRTCRAGTMSMAEATACVAIKEAEIELWPLRAQCSFVWPPRRFRPLSGLLSSEDYSERKWVLVRATSLVARHGVTTDDVDCIVAEVRAMGLSVWGVELPARLPFMLSREKPRGIFGKPRSELRNGVQAASSSQAGSSFDAVTTSNGPQAASHQRRTKRVIPWRRPPRRGQHAMHTVNMLSDDGNAASQASARATNARGLDRISGRAIPQSELSSFGFCHYCLRGIGRCCCQEIGMATSPRASATT